MFRSTAANKSPAGSSRVRVPTSGSEAIAFLRQPLSPSFHKITKNRKKDDDFCGPDDESDADEDHDSIQTAGQEYQAFVVLHRKRFCRRLCASIVLLVVLALTARGYHHRHHKQLYEYEWKRFQKFHITHKHHKDKKNASLKGQNDTNEQSVVSDPSQLTPALALKWNQHKKAAGLSHDDHHHHQHSYLSSAANTKEKTSDVDDSLNANPLDQVADGLSLAAEKIGDWMYHGVDQVLGHDAADSLHQAASNTFDTVGDLTDQVEDAAQEWELTDKLKYQVGDWYNASKESIDHWMGTSAIDDDELSNTTSNDSDDDDDGRNDTNINTIGYTLQSWANWTNGMRSSIPQKVSSLLWNYTTTTTEEDKRNAAHKDEIGGVSLNEEERTDALKQTVLQQQVSPATEGKEASTSQTKDSSRSPAPNDEEATATEKMENKESNKASLNSATPLTEKKAVASKAVSPNLPPLSKEESEASAQSLPNIMENGAGQHKIAYVTTGFPSEEGQTNRLENYILAALTTYLDKNVLFYIVNAKEKSFIQKTCAKPENQQACARLIPIYVRCPGLQYGVATCCQMDKGLSQLYEKYSQFDYYVFHQDDLYFRTEYLSTFVKSISQEPQRDAFLMSASPMRYHGQRVYEYPLTKEKLQSFHERHDCSRAPNHLYPWGRPALIYSNAALRQTVPAYKNAAVSKECEAFSVTAYAAAPIVHWMMQLPLLKLPSIYATIPDTISQVYSGSALDRGLDAGGKPQYHALQRTVAFRVDNERYNFTSLQDILEPESNQMTSEDRFPIGPYKLNWHRPNGFQETKHFHLKGPVQNWTRWETFEPRDCKSSLETKEANGRVPGKWTGYHPDHKDVREYMQEHGMTSNRDTKHQQTLKNEKDGAFKPQRSLLRKRKKLIIKT